MKTILAILTFCLITPIVIAQNIDSSLAKADSSTIQNDDEKVKALEEELDRIKRENAKDRTFYLFNKLHWGETAGMELAVATQSLTRSLWFNLGVQSPRLWDIFSIAASLDLYSQFVLDYSDTNPLQDLSRWRIGGNVRVTASSPLLFSYMRVYAAAGFIFNASPYSFAREPIIYEGIEFTPTSSFEQTEWCFSLGVELYFSESIAPFFEYGSTFGARLGLRLYLPR